MTGLIVAAVVMTMAAAPARAASDLQVRYQCPRCKRFMLLKLSSQK